MLFAAFVFGAAPSVDWLDGGSLTSSAWALGIPHPPGEPGWLVPARIAQLLPVGDIAFRTNVLSALAMAALAAPLLWISRALFGGRADRAGLLAVGLGLLGYGARMQAQRAEVYGLVALLLLLGLAAALCLTGRRSSALVGLLLGLAAAVHPFLAAAAAPGMLLARALRSSFGPSDALHGVGWGLAGFAVYSWLPLRAVANPARAWGVPDSPQRFVDVLLGRAFARNFGGEEATLANAGVVFELHALSGMAASVVFAAVAMFVLRSKPRAHDEAARTRRALAWAAPLWVLGNALTIIPQNKVLPTNPDLLGYLLVGALALVPLLSLGIALLDDIDGTPLARMRTPLLWVAVVAVGLQAVDGLSANRRDNQLARDFATAQTHGLPPGSLLMTSGNNTAFVWGYLQGVERRRPDVLVLHRVLLGHEHERLRLAPALTELGVPWSPALRSEPAAAFAGVSPPVFIEARDPERALLGSLLRRHGVVHQLGVGPEDAALASLRETVLRDLEGPVAHGDEEAALVAAMLRDLMATPR